MRQHSGIGVLDKAVTVLHAVAEHPCNLAELCERTGLPRATAHRLAIGLEVHRLLARDAAGRWRPGPALSELGAGAGDSLADAAAFVLPHLRDATGESVQLYRRDGSERVCVAALEPASGLRDTVPVGARLPMSAGSGAKILTAWCDEPVRRSILDTAAFDESELARIRRRGWAESVEERVHGVASVAAPVRDTSGAVVAAGSVSGPAVRLTDAARTRFARDAVAAADRLHAHL